jgi:hypothetical protein
MLRWLWTLFVGATAVPEPLPCNRDCKWGEGAHKRMYDYEKTGVVDEWYVQRCDTCGIIRHHVIMKDGRLQ